VPIEAVRGCALAAVLALVAFVTLAGDARAGAGAVEVEVEAAACTPAPADALGAACAPGRGVLTLALVDAATGLPSPARVEVLDESGSSWIAPGAIEVGGDCRGHASVPSDDQAAAAEPLTGSAPYVRNPQRRTYQFYLESEAMLALPAGHYRVSAFKGLAYTPVVRQVTVEAGTATRLALPLVRWIDMPALGWFSADDHLHITRSSPEDDARLARWMQAEDVNVANLLQMEIVPGVEAAPQDGFGLQRVFQDGDTIIASGQENPRTWILGHGIILGAASYIDFPDDPLTYRPYWEAAARDGALRGYAHWGTGAARDGLAIDAPAGNVEFLEVLQSDLANYDVLYQILGLGIRMTPTAGTDYPCALTNLPGRDRFYTRLDGPLTYARWLEGIRRGRTFVTNGPLLTEFRVDDAETGDTRTLEQPGPLLVRGTVRFDPARDDVLALELLRNGEVVQVARERTAPGEIRLTTSLEADGGAWLALRASGRKVDLPPFARPRTSSAHSGAIWVSVTHGTAIADQDAAGRLAADELARLARLEARLERDAKIGPPAWAGATRTEVARALPALRAAIAAARTHFEAITRRSRQDAGSSP